MDKIIGLKHESDLTDLLLSLEEGEEYVMMDEECKRLFQLTEMEKSQLGKYFTRIDYTSPLNYTSFVIENHYTICELHVRLFWAKT